MEDDIYGKISNTEFACKSNIKIRCRKILSRLGIPMSTAVDMFLNQVVLVGGIPFSVTVPKPPADIDAV